MRGSHFLSGQSKAVSESGSWKQETVDSFHHQALGAEWRQLECVFNLPILEALSHLSWKGIHSGRAWMIGGNVQGSYRAGDSRVRQQPLLKVAYLIWMAMWIKAEITPLHGVL